MVQTQTLAEAATVGLFIGIPKQEGNQLNNELRGSLWPEWFSLYGAYVVA